LCWKEHDQAALWGVHEISVAGAQSLVLAKEGDMGRRSANLEKAGPETTKKKEQIATAVSDYKR